jgi:prephenate dehydrogenase
MIVVMKERATEAQVQRVVGILSERGFDVHRSTGAHRVVLGIVGDLARVPIRRVERAGGVQRIVRISDPPAPATRPCLPSDSPPLVVAIVGMGLMGGSLAMALRAATRHRIVGCVEPGRRPAGSLRDLVDEVATDPARAVASDVVVFATPVSETLRLLAALGPRARPGSVWTDVGSVKTAICRAAARCVASGASFVGGHPMTGSEKGGLANARADLFEGATWALTPLASRRDAGALRRLREIARSIGARPLVLGAGEHDRIVAFTSHLPQIVASALAASGRDVLRTADGRRLAGPGFRDTTRLADSNEAIWHDIFVQNRGALRAALRTFMERLTRASDLSSRQVGDLFRRAHDARRALYRR